MSLPPKMLMCARARVDLDLVLAREAGPVAARLAACLRCTTSGRTPQRSAMMSASVSGCGRPQALVDVVEHEARGPRACTCGGSCSSRVSVVPMQLFGPIGITKNSRPSSAKNVSTRARRGEPVDDQVDALARTRGWCCVADAGAAALCASTYGPQALISTRARIVELASADQRRARAATTARRARASAPSDST